MIPIPVNDALATSNSSGAAAFFARLGTSSANSFADICRDQMSVPVDNPPVRSPSSVPETPAPQPVSISDAESKTNETKSGQKNSSSADTAQGILLAVPFPLPIVTRLEAAASTQQESGVQSISNPSIVDQGNEASFGRGFIPTTQMNASATQTPNTAQNGMELASGKVTLPDLAQFNAPVAVNTPTAASPANVPPPLHDTWNESTLTKASVESRNQMSPTKAQGMETSDLSPIPKVTIAGNSDVSAALPRNLKGDPRLGDQPQSQSQITGVAPFGDLIAQTAVAPDVTHSPTELKVVDSAAPPPLSTAPASPAEVQAQAFAEAPSDSPTPALKTSSAVSPKIMGGTRQRARAGQIEDPSTTAPAPTDPQIREPIVTAVSSPVQVPEVAASVPGLERIAPPQADQSSPLTSGEQNPPANGGAPRAARGSRLFPGSQIPPSSSAKAAADALADATTPPTQRKDPEDAGVPNASSATALSAAIPVTSHDPKSANVPGLDPSTPKLNSNDPATPADARMAEVAALRTPASVAGPIHLAQIVNRATQSEMRIGLNTPAFGSVEVRTVVHASDVGVMIGSEKGDLRSLLANDLPGIANTLQQQDLRLTHVSFQQSGFAFAGGFSSGGEAHSHSFAPRANPTALPQVESVSDETVQSSELSFATMRHSTRGLSVLA